MTIKGLVYVPEDGARGWLGERPGLHEVANRPLVGLILGELAAAGVGSLAVVAAPERLGELRASVAADAARDLDVSFLELAAPRQLAGAVDAARGFVGDDAVIVHVATGLLGQSYAPLVEDAAERREGVRLLMREADHPERDRPPSPAGVAVFGPGSFARAARRATITRASTRHAGDLDPARELVALADELAGEQLTVTAAAVSDWHECAGDPHSLLALNRSVLDRQSAAPSEWVGADDNQIEGRVVIHPTAEVRASVILGPALIGARARISDAYIGPYTTVGTGAVIENCEVVRSIVGPGARVAHVGDRIEGSTIGRGAKIFRDFRLPRAMRLHVGEGVEVALH